MLRGTSTNPGAQRLAAILAFMAAGSLAGCGASSPSGFSSALTPAGAADAQGSGAFSPTLASDPKFGGAASAPGANPAAGVGAVSQLGKTQVGGDASKTIASLVAPQKPGSKAYLIGSDDLLEITVFKVPDLGKSVQVTEAGTITFPLIGDVVAAGRTTTDLERELASKLGAKYLQNPQVSVLVKEYNSQRVLVDGAFTKPGVYPVRGQATLLQYVATSGGLLPTADTQVIVFRTVDGKQLAARFEVEDVRAGKYPDPEIKAGDVIIAQTSAMKEGFSNFLKILPGAGAFAQVALVL